MTSTVAKLLELRQRFEHPTRGAPSPPSTRNQRRLARKAHRKELARLARSVERGARCACGRRLRLADPVCVAVDHEQRKAAFETPLALTCDGCGAWYENGTVTFPKGKKR